MTRCMTIFSPFVKYNYVTEILDSLKIKFNFESSLEEWEQLSFELPNESVTINSLIKIERGDKFSRMKLGCANFFERKSQKKSEEKTNLVRKIASTQWALGIVIKGSDELSDKLSDIIFEITEDLDGMIFNGSDMIDADGEIIIFP